ncbi:hypothetical protein [uncultured Fibrella sp.]|uniref:hypothetical protein n=1 Tax=uncultured Fibrella sp. TaxID=1284596 RepID=UPI0035CBE701
MPILFPLSSNVTAYPPFICTSPGGIVRAKPDIFTVCYSTPEAMKLTVVGRLPSI